jgi:hypothetical protein
MKKGFMTSRVLLIVILLMGFLIIKSYYEWKKEVNYRILMQNILTEGDVAYDKLDLLMKKGSDQEINESCPDLMRVHNILASKILEARVPKKYKESHSYMKDGILDLNLSVVTICDGFKEQSKSAVLQGIEINRNALNNMVKGQDTLFIESKNKSILERILTRED